MLFTILQTLLPIFLVMGLGMLSVKLKIFSVEDSKIFSNYDYYIGFPVLIFYSLLNTNFKNVFSIPFFLTNTLNLGIVILLVLLFAGIFKMPKKVRGMLVMAGIYGNVAYMGIPLSEFIFGKSGIGYASIIVGLVSIFCLSVGIFLLEFFNGMKTSFGSILKNMAKNPIIIAVILGIFAGILNIKFPKFINDFLILVSKSAAPIALFAIGMFFFKKNVVVSKMQIFMLCIVNLLILPIITIFLGKLFGLDGTSAAFKVSILQAAMPLAATNFVLAQRYQIDQEVVANSIIYSTLFSFFTLGGFLYLFESGLI